MTAPGHAWLFISKLKLIHGKVQSLVQAGHISVQLWPVAAGLSSSDAERFHLLEHVGCDWGDPTDSGQALHIWKKGHEIITLVPCPGGETTALVLLDNKDILLQGGNIRSIQLSILTISKCIVKELMGMGLGVWEALPLTPRLHLPAHPRHGAGVAQKGRHRLPRSLCS